MTTARGWVYHPDGAVDVQVEPSPGQFSASIVKRHHRPDIEAGSKEPQPSAAGIEIQYLCADPCYFVLRTASGAVARVPVPRTSKDGGSDANGFHARYDYWAEGDPIQQVVRILPPEILLQALDNKKLSWRAGVSTAYRAALPVAPLLALGMLGWVAWRRLINKTPCVIEPLLMLGFLVVAVATRTTMIALLDAVLTAPNGLSYDYLSPGFTFYGLALALCICLPFARRDDIDSGILRPAARPEDRTSTDTGPLSA
jgi:hypothetical protein